MGRAHEVRAKAMAATAAKKSKLYSIYAKEIIKAAKSNPDPVSNDALRRIIEKAKENAENEEQKRRLQASLLFILGVQGSRRSSEHRP